MDSAKKKVKAFCIALIGTIAIFAMALTLAGCSANQNTGSSNTSGNGVVFNIDAPGWDKDTSTPVFLRFEAVPTASSSVDEKSLVVAINANEDQTVNVPNGDYKLSFISPINADGSYYDVPEKGEITISGASQNDPYPYTFEYVQAGDGTTENVGAIVASITAACTNNSEISDGDSIIELAIKNGEANPHADVSVIETMSANAKDMAERIDVEDALDETMSQTPTVAPINTTDSNKTYTYPSN